VTRLCISAAPAALDRYLAALPAMSLTPFAPFAKASARQASGKMLFPSDELAVATGLIVERFKNKRTRQDSPDFNETLSLRNSGKQELNLRFFVLSCFP